MFVCYRVSPCSPGWPKTYNPLASFSWLIECYHSSLPDPFNCGSKGANKDCGWEGRLRASLVPSSEPGLFFMASSDILVAESSLNILLLYISAFQSSCPGGSTGVFPSSTIKRIPQAWLPKDAMSCTTSAAACCRERSGCSGVRHITSLVTDASYLTSLRQFLIWKFGLIASGCCVDQIPG